MPRENHPKNGADDDDELKQRCQQAVDREGIEIHLIDIKQELKRKGSRKYVFMRIFKGFSKKS